MFPCCRSIRWDPIDFNLVLGPRYSRLIRATNVPPCTAAGGSKIATVDLSGEAEEMYDKDIEYRCGVTLVASCCHKPSDMIIYI